MQSYAERILKIVEEYSERLYFIEEDLFSRKPEPKKWSKKEILGHLCDSAINNQRRFIVLLNAENVMNMEGYNQDLWVLANNYQSNKLTCKELITLWVLLNKQITSVLETFSHKDYEKEIQFSDGRRENGNWLVNDYIEHMLHHLEEINRS